MCLRGRRFLFLDYSLINWHGAYCMAKIIQNSWIKDYLFIQLSTILKIPIIFVLLINVNFICHMRHTDKKNKNKDQLYYYYLCKKLKSDKTIYSGDITGRRF